MGVFVVGIVSIIFFYLAVLAVGIWAGRRYPGDSELDTMNAGGRLGAFVGTLTLVATWAGGGYITGTAEKIYANGILSCKVPIGYSIALILGAYFFIRRMRDGGYITLLDPFQIKYGNRYGACLILPALCSEFFWCAAVLNSLGTALRVILGIKPTEAIIVSAVFAGLYTIVGGLISVSYTDVLELIFIVFGLVLSVPFAFYNENVIYSLNSSQVMGYVDKMDAAQYVDDMLVLALGGIPWQGYFQRVFSIKSTSLAMNMSWLSTVGCLLVAIPAVFVGIVAKKTDWANVKGFEKEITPSEYSLVLPLVLRYLTPAWVAFFGLGSISGAVMASADSAILASSAMMSRNVYKHIFRPNASDKEIHYVLRCAIVLMTTLAALIALTVDSIYYLSFMCSDLVYVVLFPQLFLVLYLNDFVNTYGSLSAYLFGVIFRGLAGEEGLGIPAVMKYPYYDEKDNLQRFPFRTLIMISSIILFLSVSALTNKMNEKGWLTPKYDFLGAFVEKPPPPPQ